MKRQVVAGRDARLRAAVRRVVPLRYSAGAETRLDRPAHVRAGSALVAVGGRLAVVQDDAGFVALVDPASGAVESVTLPADNDVRQWDDGRGNKAEKPDLEAAVVVGDTLIAFGSGSTGRRERILVVEGIASAEPEPRWVHAAALYAMLRPATDFSGSEMNLEAAAVVGDRLVLFNRGNGAPRGALQPVNATCQIALDAFLGYLDGAGAAPAIECIRGYRLGTLAGAPLGFTDAAVHRGHVLFSAAAERSPDTYRDGEVTGSAIGWIDEREASWVEVTDEAGLFTGKIEGIAAHRTDSARLWAVVDRDDPEAASDLCEVELIGPWPG